MGLQAKPGSLRGLIVPHSLTVIEDENRGHRSVAAQALRRWRADAMGAVDAVIAISPFWLPEDAFYVDTSPMHHARADYQGYEVDLRYQCPGDHDLAHALVEAGRGAGLPITPRRHGADPSAIVSMHYLFPKGDVPLVPLSSSELSLGDALRWGKAIRGVVEASGRRVLLLCGGGLSHNMTACLHWEDSIAAVIFDQKVLAHLKEGHGKDVTKLDDYWIQVGNPTAAFSDLYMFLGAVGEKAKGKLLCYDGAPGVGWAVMEF